MQMKSVICVVTHDSDIETKGNWAENYIDEAMINTKTQEEKQRNERKTK